jgi:gamma-tubulin complex component 2
MPTCDESLLFLVSKILPTCTIHDRIKIFQNVHSHFDFGLVNHALCEGIEELLNEHLLRITQMDNEFSKGELTL